MKKTFVAANDLLLDSFQLAANIYQSGFRPDFLVGLWRGGSAVGIIRRWSKRRMQFVLMVCATCTSAYARNTRC